MVDKIRKGWRIISWRSACLLSALLLHAWGFSSPVINTEKSSAAYQPQSSSVSLSFVAPNIEKKAVSQKSKSAYKKVASVEQISRKKTTKTIKETKQPKPLKAQKDKQNETLATAQNQPKVIEQYSAAPTEQATQEEESLASTPSAHTPPTPNTGVHSNPIINKPLFDQPPIPPKYPTTARKRGQQGTVWLEIWLDEWGKQARLQVMQSSGIKALDKAALRAVANWHFKPHRINGLGIASRVQIPVEFALN